MTKEEDIMFILNQKYHENHVYRKNLKFKIDCFDENNIQFLDIAIKKKKKKKKMIYTKNPIILISILILTKMFRGIIKFIGLIPLTTYQRTLFHQAKSLGFKFTR